MAISVQETSPADVASYAARYGLGYTIGFDGSGKIFHAYKGFGLPTQVFIDENGVIASIVGAPLDEAGAIAQIEAILPKAAGRRVRRTRRRRRTRPRTIRSRPWRRASLPEPDRPARYEASTW